MRLEQFTIVGEADVSRLHGMGPRPSTRSVAPSRPDRRMEMLLENRNAVVCSAGGAIGGAVARAFAREGARVFLAGRTKAPLEKVAEEVRGRGGAAETAVVDALDERAVRRRRSHHCILR